jgi:ethanolamine ammonia-lyase small subunit
MEQTEGLIKNNWETLKQYTAARIALGRAGAGLPTDEYLQFKLSHAQAKDAVWQPFDRMLIAEALRQEEVNTLFVESSAGSRQEYLTRPDLGRKLSARSAEALSQAALPPADLLIVVADGLSSIAMHTHAVPFIRSFLPYVADLGKTLYPVVIAERSRVALGDEIGHILGAQLIVMLIGERPGLSSPDSMGIYLTWKPAGANCPDSERNCISNVRPQGLTYDKAAFKLAWLAEQAFAMNRTGISLKDMSDDPACHQLIKPKDKCDMRLL